MSRNVRKYLINLLKIWKFWGKKFLKILRKPVMLTVTDYCKILQLAYIRTYLSGRCSMLQVTTANHFVVVTYLTHHCCIRCRNSRLNILFCIFHIASCHVVVSYVGEHQVERCLYPVFPRRKQFKCISWLADPELENDTVSFHLIT